MIGPRGLRERVGRVIRVGDIEVIGIAPELDAYRLVRRLALLTDKKPGTGPQEIQHLLDATFAGNGLFAVSRDRRKPETFHSVTKDKDGNEHGYESIRWEKWVDHGCMFGNMIRMVAVKLDLPRRFVMEYEPQEWAKICGSLCAELTENGEPDNPMAPWYPDGWRKSYEFYAPRKRVSVPALVEA